MPTSLDNSLREPRPYLLLTCAPKISLPEVALKMDEIWPGWHRKVDTHTLDLSKAKHCILGQVNEWGYSGGIDRLDAHGVRYDKEYFLSNTGYREAWIDEITARLAREAPPKPPSPVRRVLTSVSTLVLRCLP